MKLNLGCGSQVINGWINVDYALGARLAKLPLFRKVNKLIKIFNLDWDNRIFINNLTKPFPWQDCSVDIVYCSHTLEHFSREDGVRFLNECHRVLKKDGIIRIIVPDFRYFVYEYLKGNLKAIFFLEVIGIGSMDDKSFKGILASLIKFPHKCMYDAIILLEILSGIGFNVEERKPFDSAIEDIMQIELEERTVNAVIVEGKKC